MLYPTPSAAVEKLVDRTCIESIDGRKAEKFQFLFAGNSAHWYGKQVASILNVLENDPAIGMKVFGKYHSWAPKFERAQRHLGAYMGFKPYEELIPEFQKADAFLWRNRRGLRTEDAGRRYTN